MRKKYESDEMNQDEEVNNIIWYKEITNWFRFDKH